jgi:hypothetical protein
VGGEVLLGAKLSAEAIAEPTLNSQDRFYGAAFSLNAGMRHSFIVLTIT